MVAVAMLRLCIVAPLAVRVVWGLWLPLLLLLVLHQVNSVDVAAPADAAAMCVAAPMGQNHSQSMAQSAIPHTLLRLLSTTPAAQLPIGPAAQPPSQLPATVDMNGRVSVHAK